VSSSLWIVIIAIIVVIAVLVIVSLRIIPEYQRGVAFRLGRIRPLYGPGVRILLPLLDSLHRVDLRVVTLTIPPQDVITKDNVPARVNAVVLFRVVEPLKAIMEVENFAVATSQIAQTTLRSLLGRVDLDALLAHRDELNLELQKIIDKETEPWGIEVNVVEIKDIEIPKRCSGRWPGKQRPNVNAEPR
jgi:regulator of protease activity HflC (stomatin/prohibitin superfamily)